jgi:hypothetical protein
MCDLLVLDIFNIIPWLHFISLDLHFSFVNLYSLRRLFYYIIILLEISDKICQIRQLHVKSLHITIIVIIGWIVNCQWSFKFLWNP